jgi:hypothetical protein
MAADEGPYDVLTGHAGARFRWIDVRPESARESAPVQYTHTAVPLPQLLQGVPVPYPRAASLAVFGEGHEDTAQAVEELQRRGYQNVLALSGERHGGYAWLAHSGLT